MPERPIARALTTWLAVHPQARQVFRHVHELERQLRRGRVESVSMTLLERAQDELRHAGFERTDILDALSALEERLWHPDRIGGIEVQEIGGARKK